MSLVEQLRGGLIVSCQARPDEPLYGSQIMAAMAKSAALGGAVGIRANTPEDIRAIRAAVSLPLIGLYKITTPGSEVYITPSSSAAQQVAAAGADIIAIDATPRKRARGETVAEIIENIHQHLNKLVMADISTLEEGIAAEQFGADLVSTTLSGYTPYSPQIAGPDLELVGQLANRIKIPVIAEGRIHTPEELVTALSRGAYAVVIGGAITRPQLITARFVTAIKESGLTRIPHGKSKIPNPPPSR
ncbi:MAG: N-acetylmannosamine-6-phosphate 2-epimerase [bacterium]|nr:N-acetylmannosamine-6-phosphate 2-epimerase [bacterium]